MEEKRGNRRDRKEKENQSLFLMDLGGGGSQPSVKENKEFLRGVLGLTTPLDTHVNSEIWLYFTTQKKFPRFCCFH